MDVIMAGTVSLSLKDHDITVDKEKLSRSSKYFAALFSHNFKDSKEEAYCINIDIDVKVLQSFADWIDDKESLEPPHAFRPSLMSYISENFIQLLDLLKLSVFYAVDQLTDDIIAILVTKWLQPENLICIWKLAEELNLRVLRSLCIMTCLDRCEEFGELCLMELSMENMQQLTTLSSRLRLRNGYVRQVSKKWSQHHAESLPICSSVVTLPNFIRCGVGYKLDNRKNRKAFIYNWDGGKLSELVEPKDCESGSVKEIIGMQATGRGFAVYVVGGERGFGTGNFNMEIWRYCLISERWYYQSRLPVARRHMVVAFLDNKLAIVGGVGRLRLKLNSVDILDVHTGQWTRGAKVPEEFTDVPPHCVMKGKLFLLKSSVYIYDPETDCWQTVSLPIDSPALKADALVVYGETFFYTYTDDQWPAKTMLFRVEAEQSLTSSVTEYSDTYDYDEKIMNEMCAVSTNSDACHLRFVRITGANVLFLATEREAWAGTNLKLYGQSASDSYTMCINPKLGCFDLINRNILCCDDYCNSC